MFRLFVLAMVLPFGVVGQTGLLDQSGPGFTIGGINGMLADTVNDRLILAGSFTRTRSQVVTTGIASYSAGVVSPLGCGFEWDCTTPIGLGALANPMVALAIWNGELYAGGGMTSSNGVQLNHVARFDGANWQPLLAGCDGPVYSLRAYPDGLYAAGWFTYADTVEANGLARWDGAQWHRVFNLPDITPVQQTNAINDLYFYQDELYIGGKFVGLNDMNNIAKYDGTQWVKVGTGQGLLGVYAGVNRFAEHDGKLYVAGSFSDYPPYGNSQNPGSGIVAWDGQNWDGLEGGTNGSYNAGVTSIEWYDDTLYASGPYDNMGGIPAWHLAKWDGTRWCSMLPPNYTNNVLQSIRYFQDSLFIGGGFTVCGVDSVFRLAKWVGGDSVTGCGSPMSVEEEAIEDLYSLYPNPATDRVAIKVNGQPYRGNYRITDALGRTIMEGFSAGSVHVSVLPPGAYVVTVLPKTTEPRSIRLLRQ
jgi:hypothetical protein